MHPLVSHVHWDGVIPSSTHIKQYTHSSRALEDPDIRNHGTALLKRLCLKDLDIQRSIEESLDLVDMFRLPLMLKLARNARGCKGGCKEHGMALFELVDGEHDVLHVTEKRAALVEVHELVDFWRRREVFKSLGGVPMDIQRAKCTCVLGRDDAVGHVHIGESSLDERLGAQLGFRSVENESRSLDVPLASKSDEASVDFVLVRIILETLSKCLLCRALHRPLGADTTSVRIRRLRIRNVAYGTAAGAAAGA